MRPGDRVKVRLPARYAPKTGPHHTRDDWFIGTVRAVDEIGMPIGIRIDLDERLHGVSDCYAARSEIQLVAQLGRS